MSTFLFSSDYFRDCNFGCAVATRVNKFLQLYVTKLRGLDGARYYKRTDHRYKDENKLLLFEIKAMDMKGLSVLKKTISNYIITQVILAF